MMVTNISVLVKLALRDFYCHWIETETSFNNEIKGDNHIAIAWHKTERNVNPAALAFRRAIFFIAAMKGLMLLRSSKAGPGIGRFTKAEHAQRNAAIRPRPTLPM
jgi:hypothetical protein